VSFATTVSSEAGAEVIKMTTTIAAQVLWLTEATVNANNGNATTSFTFPIAPGHDIYAVGRLIDVDLFERGPNRAQVAITSATLNGSTNNNPQDFVWGPGYTSVTFTLFATNSQAAAVCEVYLDTD
jgi:hypothetical protein